MNAVSIVGLAMLCVGALSIISSGGVGLKGDRSYTFVGGIALSGLGLLAIGIGARCLQ